MNQKNYRFEQKTELWVKSETFAPSIFEHTSLFSNENLLFKHKKGDIVKENPDIETYEVNLYVDPFEGTENGFFFKENVFSFSMFPKKNIKEKEAKIFLILSSTKLLFLAFCVTYFFE